MFSISMLLEDTFTLYTGPFFLRTVQTIGIHINFLYASETAQAKEGSLQIGTDRYLTICQCEILRPLSIR